MNETAATILEDYTAVFFGDPKECIPYAIFATTADALAYIYSEEAQRIAEHNGQTTQQILDWITPLEHWARTL
jgi:hypothetical protein